MNNDHVTRLRYFEQQFLRTQDFTDEQAYHLTMRRRHNIAQHTWGIVAGLELEVFEDEIFVLAGMAVDGYGRSLILPHKQPLLLTAFEDKESDTLDVWLIYRRQTGEVAPKGFVSANGNGANTAYRWQEQPLIRLTKSDLFGAFNPREPEVVPDAEWDFHPHNSPPDDPKREWPVFLGRMIRNPPDADSPFSVDLADRPYVGLRGEAVISPSGRASIHLGSEKKDDPRRFALTVSNDDTSETTALQVKQNGQVDINGNTTIHGDLTVKGKAIILQAGQARSPDAPPWRIYHHLEEPSPEGEGTADPADDQPQTSDQANGQSVETTSGEPQGTEHQLRIEMPAGVDGLNQVVIGAWSADDEAFKPTLTVADNGIVTVHGNLIVQGNIQEVGARPESELSEEAKRFLQSSILSGVSGASIQLQKFYRRLGLI